ncbi:MAG TPA: colicin D domain-containing protein [Jatrophihabitans sp.]
MEKYIPTADTGRLDDAATACRNAGGVIQDLVNGLHTQLQSLVGNNTSDDLAALEQFWQRAAGPQSILAELPAALGKLSESLVDFRVWNVDTQQKIKDKIKEVVDDMAVVGVILVIGSIATDGALDVLIAAVIEGLELFGADAAGALVAPVAEVVTAAEAILITAGGAIAITQGVVPAMQTAMSSTPNPNIESADAAKISDEIAAHEVPEPNYPEGQLQRHFKHAKDFGVDQNWSNAGAKAYEDALRKFAGDLANSIKTADVGRYRGEPAILIYNENTRVCEVLRPDGTYWTGWKLNVQQLGLPDRCTAGRRDGGGRAVGVRR